MTFRTTVSLDADLKERIEQYAKRHGASIPGALAALAARALDADDAERSSSVTSGSQDGGAR